MRPGGPVSGGEREFLAGAHIFPAYRRAGERGGGEWGGGERGDAGRETRLRVGCAKLMMPRDWP